MPQIQAVIFDMFETLVYDRPAQWDTTLAEIIAKQGLAVTPAALRQRWDAHNVVFRDTRANPAYPFRSYYAAWADSFRRAFADLGAPGDANAATDRCFAALTQRKPYPETPEALRQVQSQTRTALLSNADDAFLFPTLERLGWRFEVELSSEMAQVYKPRAELFQEALRRLSLRPEQAVYVGDRQLEDVSGAAGAGLPAVWLNRHGTPPNPNLPTPAGQIASLLELPELLAEFSQRPDGDAAAGFVPTAGPGHHRPGQPPAADCK